MVFALAGDSTMTSAFPMVHLLSLGRWRWPAPTSQVVLVATLAPWF